MQRGRRGLLLALAASLAGPRPLFGQAAETVSRVAVVVNGTVESDRPFLGPFLQGLRSHGYTEERNVVLEFKYLEGRFDLLPATIAELLARNPSVLVVNGSRAAWAAKKATRTVPIVMASVGDPVRLGLVASLARPGGNITGNAILSESIAFKRLELLREVAPQASRIAYLMNRSNPAFAPLWKELEPTARKLGIDLTIFEVMDATTVDASLVAVAGWRPHAVLVGTDPITNTYRSRIIASLAKIRVPAMYGASQSALEGGLMSYSHDGAAVSRNTARFVDRILKGAKPSDLPVEQPTHFELIVNLKTAKALGIKLPPLVLASATKVIE